MGTVNVARALADIVGPAQVVTDPDSLLAHTVDWSGRFSGRASALVRPGSVAEVSALMQWCSATETPIHPQGGNTSLVGGGIPSAAGKPAVIINTGRLNTVEVDEHGGAALCGAGATLEQLQFAAAQRGRLYGVDIAARASATVGGTVATNAGGIRVCAFGMTRDQVHGVQAVLPDGTVVSHLRGLEKDNTGIRWSDLLIGSEGTLATVTAVSVRLLPAMGETSLILAAVDSIEQAQAVVSSVAHERDVRAAELMEARGVDIASEFAGLPPLFLPTPPYCLLLEVSGQPPDISWPSEVLLAGDAADRRRFWLYRELQSEAAGLMAQQFGVTVSKLDVSVPLWKLAAFRIETDRILADIGVYDHYVFGHIADGNLHLELAARPDLAEAATKAVLELVSALGGSISAEHGIGRAKAKYLRLGRSEAEIDLMRRLKESFDPMWLMAPGVIFEETS